ncbi:CoA-transferase family III [Colletotrichum graminicola]|uniref:CoA-transferase family III n=1 Tax=Colletotrichum graminicola (strain M1.001 / M2 / FGSC 10212) TaxID=645133 RepID=E3QCI2_COLGM|nr:CoA-transferase family III [Colletotrichum graminicola M1.001]EFQ28570.1 CoA-transferase family III [Colletotrichum graminicola M1.001]WDK15928.1 CoA-transferase family III [Colletotrichum graminicola]
MVPKRPGSQRATTSYSVKEGSENALAALIAACQRQLPPEFVEHLRNVVFIAPQGDVPYFPCPLKEQEATASIKALEGMAAAALSDFRHGPQAQRHIEVDVARTACFLMSAYLTTVNGMDKGHPNVKAKIPDTDLNQAQSILYRRLSANLYETKDVGEYYHLHGSLEASRALNMIGLPAFNPELQGYSECIKTIETAMKCFSVQELEEMNRKEGQAGVPVLKKEQFSNTPHGKVLEQLPPLTVKPIESITPPAPFEPRRSSSGAEQCLSGIRVLELCRIIAGPTIGRSLAAHGASVLKVTSPNLPDVPFFQVDVNTGKHATSLHLKDPEDRATFESLLASADVILDGYRPGVVDRLGYGPEKLAVIAASRGKGFVYVAEDCFGGSELGVAKAEWAGRPGWQQIADCVTGVAWEQGHFMGLDAPVVPPFPMSDYGTGALGAVGAMAGLYRRATEGGSWACRTSLCQYDVFLLSLGAYPPEVQARLRKTHSPAFFDLRHHDSVDEVGKRALHSVKHLHPELFAEDLMHRAWSPGFDAEVRWPREAVRIGGLRVGHNRASRPNGADAPLWEDWEVQDDIVGA